MYKREISPQPIRATCAVWLGLGMGWKGGWRVAAVAVVADVVAVVADVVAVVASTVELLGFVLDFFLGGLTTMYSEVSMVSLLASSNVLTRSRRCFFLTRSLCKAARIETSWDLDNVRFTLLVGVSLALLLWSLG